MRGCCEKLYLLFVYQGYPLVGHVWKERGATCKAQTLDTFPVVIRFLAWHHRGIIPALVRMSVMTMSETTETYSQNTERRTACI
jgi:hypothetical protein